MNDRVAYFESSGFSKKTTPNAACAPHMQWAFGKEFPAALCIYIIHMHESWRVNITYLTGPSKMRLYSRTNNFHTHIRDRYLEDFLRTCPPLNAKRAR